MAVSTILLALLPPLLCVGLCLRPLAFAGGLSELGVSGRRNLGGLVLAGAAVCVPVFLWLLWRDHGFATRVGMVMTAFAAAWGAYRLGGLAGAYAAAGGALACALKLPGSLWAFNALTLCAGIGGALLLCAMIPSEKALWRMLVGVAAFDCLWIGSGIGGQTVALLPGVFEHTPILRDAAAAAPAPAVYNRVLLDQDLLGSGDVFFAAALAALLTRLGIARREIAPVAGWYLAVAAAMFAFSYAHETAIPATVPGLAALAVFWARRRGEARVADAALSA